MIEFSFVIDANGKKLSPTPKNNAWYLIRKGKAVLVSKYPMLIELKRIINTTEQDQSEFVCGLDDGSKHVGIAIVQKCKTKNKVVFKGTIEQRQDVSSLMEVRKGYRKYHRQHKRYRKARFNNRASSKRKERLAPSIKQKKDAIIRVVTRLNKYCNINTIRLEDIQIDIRALQEGQKLYKWQYQKSNRLDENLRKATIMRDNNKCMECGKSNCVLEVHHIVPKRLHGSDIINNLIALCEKCHSETKGNEEQFIEKYQKLINGKNIRFDYAQHVMQGKHYLRSKLNDVAPLGLTIGSETANKRIDWNVKKSHSNDAIVITGLKIGNCDVKDWTIKPMRRQSKAKHDGVSGYKHRDLASYIDTKNITYVGYITGMYPDKNQINIQSKEKHLKRCNISRCKLLWKFNKIYWI
jgi:5-methylcytosine-specific restriction endonuclease McrA